MPPNSNNSFQELRLKPSPPFETCCDFAGWKSQSRSNSKYRSKSKSPEPLQELEARAGARSSLM